MTARPKTRPRVPAWRFDQCQSRVEALEDRLLERDREIKALRATLADTVHSVNLLLEVLRIERANNPNPVASPRLLALIDATTKRREGG